MLQDPRSNDHGNVLSRIHSGVSHQGVRLVILETAIAEKKQACGNNLCGGDEND
jgi:hypothetical protein